MKWTHYVYLCVMCVFTATNFLVHAQITNNENACVWGISNDELAIPTGSVITEAVLVLQNVRSTRTGAALSVQLLNNPSAGLEELSDVQTGNYFDGYGTPLAAIASNELSASAQTFTLDLNQIENPNCWTRSIFETAPVVTLADAQTITCSSALLALFDYAGTGRAFGFGIDCDGVSIEAIDLHLTIQSSSTLSTPTQLTFSEGTVNTAPVLDAIDDQTISENQTLQLTVSATDADGDSLSYSAENLPAGAVFSGQTLSWTPTYSQAGTYDILFSVTDGAESDTQTVTVTVLPVNQAPVLSAIGNKATAEGQAVTFTISATDPDNDALTLTCSPLPAGASFVGGRFSWTPGYNQSGDHTLTFQVSDGVLTDSETMVVSVSNTNRTPVLGQIIDQTVTVPDTLTVTVPCTDADNDTISLSSQNLPGGATLDNGVLTWTPTADQAGTWSITIIANDTNGGTDTMTFQVTVDAPVKDWAQLIYDDFENGIGNYTDGGRDCKLDTRGRYAHQGSGTMNIQDNSGSDSSFTLTNGLNITGYSELKIEFWYQPVSMDNSNEDFRLEYWNGSQWTVLKSWAKDRDFQNNQFYFETVTITDAQAVFAANAKIRFVCDASSNYDDVYIDEISISAK
ncbi:MAG: putative Ig domain-containing protein [Planctomycetota bacterium]